MSSKKPAVSLSMGGRLKPVQSAQVQNVFGDEDSDEEKPQTSAEKFHSKYGNLKARDERAVKKVLEENPDIYDYDGAYDSMQERRSRVEQEKESAKVDKKPKYTEKLLQSKKKRDLENLLRDERKQQKERKAEGDEFKDKDVFVTSSYRKQLEETVKFRKELEDSDQIDEVTSVRGQQMWRENFGKKLLDERIKQRFGDDTIEKEEENTESHKRKRSNSPKRTSHREEETEVHKRKRSNSPKRTSHRDSRRDEGRHSQRDRDSRRDEDRYSRRDRDSRRDDDRHSNRRDRDSRRDDDRHSHRRDRDSRRDGDSRRDDDRHSKRKRSKSPKKAGYKEAERSETQKRMQAVRRILQQRNTVDDIEAARKRYFERREAGLIVPPV